MQFTYEASSDAEEEPAGIDPLEESDEWLDQFDYSHQPKSTFGAAASDGDPLELNAKGKKASESVCECVRKCVKASESVCEGE